MMRIRLIPAFAIVATSATLACAQARIPTRTLTCSALMALVARDREVVLAATEFVYEAVHADAGRCRLDETALPAFEPTSDERSCFAGWRCVQRANDPGQK